MFTASRYVTSGIAEEVGLDLQILLGSLIDIWKKEYEDTMDYLQVFELEVIEPGTPNIRVIHRQEVPPREEEYYFRVSTPIDARIFCIDDKTHSTMLFAREYYYWKWHFSCRGPLGFFFSPKCPFQVPCNPLKCRLLSS